LPYIYPFIHSRIPQPLQQPTLQQPLYGIPSYPSSHNIRTMVQLSVSVYDKKMHAESNPRCSPLHTPQPSPLFVLNLEHQRKIYLFLLCTILLLLLLLFKPVSMAVPALLSRALDEGLTAAVEAAKALVNSGPATLLTALFGCLFFTYLFTRLFCDCLKTFLDSSDSRFRTTTDDAAKAAQRKADRDEADAERSHRAAATSGWTQGPLMEGGSMKPQQRGRAERRASF